MTDKIDKQVKNNAFILLCRQTGAHSNVTALGKATKVDSSLKVKEKLSEYVPFGSIKQYKRILIRGVTYTTKSYTQPVKQCDLASYLAFTGREKNAWF